MTGKEAKGRLSTLVLDALRMWQEGENRDRILKRFKAELDKLNLAVAEPCPNRCVQVSAAADGVLFFVDPLPKEKTP